MRTTTRRMQSLLGTFAVAAGLAIAGPATADVIEVPEWTPPVSAPGPVLGPIANRFDPTDVAAAPSELVCSIDADCTYDPHEIGRLVEALEHGAVLVTASPYHPEGHVVGVPRWRLALSRTLSTMYRQALGSTLHTYTSCFRGYRRSAFTDLTLRHRGFLGVAETLARMIISGAAVTEIPATLESRLIGRSKMRVLPVIVGHLRLLADLGRLRRLHGQEQTGGTEVIALRA